MNNWYKQKAFFLILISLFFSKAVEIAASEHSNIRSLNSNQLLENTAASDSGKLFNRFTNEALLYNRNYAKREMQLISVSNKSILPNNVAETLKVDNWLARQQNSCQSINSAYQQVYSFQTDNYYIKICQLGGSFYYHRQSKFDNDTLLIPAWTVYSGGVFQATNKGTTYLVGKDGDRYYSSVMQNDNEIVFEPELQLSPDSVLARDIAEINSQLPVDGVKADRAANASLEDRPENDALSFQQASICSEANTSNSQLHDWQQLLGESLNTASTYAFNNGYSFIYDAKTPRQASIATQAAIVNLNIAPTSNTIERVCIRSLAEN